MGRKTETKKRVWYGQDLDQVYAPSLCVGVFISRIFEMNIHFVVRQLRLLRSHRASEPFVSEL